MTISFFVRQRGKEKRLYARLTHDKKATEILLDYVVSGKGQENAYCDKVRRDLIAIFNQQLMTNQASDVQAIKTIYTTRYKVHNLLEVFQDYITKKIRPRYDNNEMSLSGYRKYQVCYNHLHDFLQCRQMDDINIASVDRAFIDDFDSYLKQFNQHNSIIKQMTYLRAILNYAKNVQGFIIQNPFDTFSMKRKKRFPVYLEMEELRKIARKKHLVDRLVRVRDLFLFQCFTGLSYADMAGLQNVDHKAELLIVYRKKTNERSVVYLYDVAKQILKKYNNELPVISNVKMNAYLKELSVICGIDKVLTTHVARHTFATTVNLNSGVPLQVVKSLLGHSSIKQTEHYAQLQTNSVIQHCVPNNARLNSLYKLS